MIEKKRKANLNRVSNIGKKMKSGQIMPAFIDYPDLPFNGDVYKPRRKRIHFDRINLFSLYLQYYLR
jgi:hypothetical protein